MRFLFTFFFTVFYLSLSCQKIEYRHDSLFVNSFYVDAQTSKIIIDSLLNSTGESKTNKQPKFIKTKGTKTPTQTADYYYNQGLYFMRYSDNTTRLSVGIKLYRNTDMSEENKDSRLTKIFNGQLFIGNNYINDKRTVEQLSTLKDCIVKPKYARIGSTFYLLYAEIFCDRNLINVVFDRKLELLSSIHIHHNFQLK